MGSTPMRHHPGDSVCGLHWKALEGFTVGSTVFLLANQCHAGVLGCFDIKRHRLLTASPRSRALNQAVGKICTTLAKHPKSTHHLIRTLHQQLFRSQNRLQRLRYLLSSELVARCQHPIQLNN